MKPSPATRYQPTDNGYQITGSREIFNRTLYGSHTNDDLQERFFTLAGDTPLVMGTVTDWSKHTACHYAKCGVLMSGLALTPGVIVPHFYSSEVDNSSQWFHEALDTTAVFRNGWMDYRLQQFSPWFPDAKVTMSVFPLMPEDGFLVQYRITTDQRVIFCAGFGGVTDFMGRFEYVGVKERTFHAADCQGNTVVCKKNKALVCGKRGDKMWIGASFPVQVQVGDAASLEKQAPGMFLASPRSDAAPAVRLSAPILPGQTLEGFIVVLRNQDENVLERWLKHKDPAAFLKQQIRFKHAAVSVHTPDTMFNLTVPPTVLAMDASWHKRTFHHGAHGYHSPFLGWRNWYGPTVIGWHDRVKKAINSHFSDIPKKAPGKEAVWYDGKDRPDLDHEGTQYHHIQNSTGFVPALLGKNDIYNMQEVAVDMALHQIEWTGDLKFAKQVFEDIEGILDWETRILDPDKDGLYQNFLNTWISDGHSYNGGGCAQASAYNYAANRIMAKLAGLLGYPDKIFKDRAKKIRKALHAKLWQADKGCLAEFIDTIGHKRVHPSPELSTIYLAIDCGVVDAFQAYQMLRFTETQLRSETTPCRNGRLVYSSNWYPKKYSTCGLFPAENIHLALAYFQAGQKEKGLQLLNAITEGYFAGKYPGLVSHVLTGTGVGDVGDLDFSDVSSMYLRLMVEGLFGIRFRLLDKTVDIAPHFPDDWTHADLQLKDMALQYTRQGLQEDITVYCDKPCTKRILLPLRSSRIESVFLNGSPAPYKTQAAVNHCLLVVETEAVGRLHLQVIHGSAPIPSLEYPATILTGNTFSAKVLNGVIAEYQDPSAAFENSRQQNNALYAEVKAESGEHTLFVRTKIDEYEAWLAADVQIEAKTMAVPVPPLDKRTAERFKPLDISPFFNASLKGLHTLEYRTPRPKGYSIGVRLNGRYAWEWNHAGHNAVHIDDTALRQANGVFVTPSGLKFAVPKEGSDIACVSIWDNFPSTMRIPLKGKARELALFFIGVTNAMQSGVENARFVVTYRDGSEHTTSLIHPKNFDDWLVPALQAENETVYFSDYNHGIVQRITLDPEKELSGITMEAFANEAILGLLGVSVLPAGM